MSFAEQDDPYTLLLNAETLTKADRVKIASGLSRIYKQISASIPNASVEENDWVKKEEADLAILRKSDMNAYGRRHNSFWKTPAYQKINLKKLLQEIVLQLETITQSRKKITLKEEITSWAFVVYLLHSSANDIDNGFKILEESKAIDLSQSVLYLQNRPDYWDLHKRIADEIQYYIVIKYLYGNISR